MAGGIHPAVPSLCRGACIGTWDFVSKIINTPPILAVFIMSSYEGSIPWKVQSMESIGICQMNHSSERSVKVCLRCNLSDTACNRRPRRSGGRSSATPLYDGLPASTRARRPARHLLHWGERPGAQERSQDNFKDSFRDARHLREIDRHFAEFIQKLEGEHDQKIWLAAALTSQATQLGHVCLDIPLVAGKKIRNEETEEDRGLICPDL